MLQTRRATSSSSTTTTTTRVMIAAVTVGRGALAQLRVDSARLACVALGARLRVLLELVKPALQPRAVWHRAHLDRAIGGVAQIVGDLAARGERLRLRRFGRRLRRRTATRCARAGGGVRLAAAE